MLRFKELIDAQLRDTGAYMPRDIPTQGYIKRSELW